MKRTTPTMLILSGLLGLSGNSSATVIAFWDFNDGYAVADNSPQIVHNATTGSGTIYQQRADTDGNGKGGNAFVDVPNGINATAGVAMAWNDVAKTGDNDAEFFIAFSTAGFASINVSFDLRGNLTIIPSFDLKYSLNALEDVTNPGAVIGTIKDFSGGISTEIFNNNPVNAVDSFMRVTVDLSSYGDISDASFVALRFDDWDNGTGNNDMRIDNVLITASPVPEPSSVLLGVIGALGLLRRRR